ncbi:MAG: xylose isomerase [Spirochaetaceae bacterium]|jgi:xylose isomerase|nr:xylose isomerase [Spirochaetaceae bacterium]
MSNYFKGSREFFPGIAKICFEGKTSKNPLAFKFYNPQEKLGELSMEEHLRFAVAYWHSFCGDGGDPFGNATQSHPWNQGDSPLQRAENKADAAFEFFTKLGVKYYCFHDVDASPDAESVVEYEENYQKVAEMLLQRQQATGVKLLWNTSNLFSHPRYANGAATNPDFHILSRGAAQVKKSLDVNVMLGGENYVFWGGREGYTLLQNTMMQRELDHLAQFLSLSRDYGRKIGFTGTFLIEPKPMEPSKHQYDVDAATVIGFLSRYGLDKDFKLNIEANHATLAGHDFAHDLQVAADAGLLGSIDANRGDPVNGWDTDQFPTDILDATKAMMVVLDNGGLGSGGLNFDAKLRRNSTDAEDLFIGHIGGMDSFALALKIAHRVKEEGVLAKMLTQRYQSFDSGTGAKFEAGQISLEELRDFAIDGQCNRMTSGKQELIENYLNQVMFSL